MSVQSVALHVAATDTAVPAPPCPGCAAALGAAGTGRHRYWLCGSCGMAMRRS